MFKRIKGLFSQEAESECEQTVVLPIPNCFALALQLTGKMTAAEVEHVKQSYRENNAMVAVHPFMTKADYMRWLESVLTVGSLTINMNLITIDIISALPQEIDPEITFKLVNAIKQQEGKTSVNVNVELMNDLGNLRRAIKKIKLDKLTDKDQKQLTRLLIEVKKGLSITLTQRWLEQINQLYKKTWSRS